MDNQTHSHEKNSPAVPPSIFKLELVAAIAAQLLESDNYVDAVTKARRLIQEAYNQESRANFEKKRALLEDAPAVPYKKAIAQITNQDHETGATKRFRELLRDQRMWGEFAESAPGMPLGKWSEDGKKVIVSEDAIAAIIAARKTKGFSQTEIQDFRSAYLMAFPHRKPKTKKNSLGGAEKTKKSRSS